MVVPMPKRRAEAGSGTVVAFSDDENENVESA
jgi:hypothetical protein